MSTRNFFILIVDDNRDFVRRIKSILEEMSPAIIVDSATNYHEVYEGFFARKPDLIILDIRLPGENGMTILRKIRKDCLECKVIMNSNFANEHYRQQCLDIGANYFLDKTNDVEILPELVRKYAMKPYSVAN